MPSYEHFLVNTATERTLNLHGDMLENVLICRCPSMQHLHAPRGIVKVLVLSCHGRTGQLHGDTEA